MLIGTRVLNAKGTSSYNIPGQVPSNATDVLVYIAVSNNDGPYLDIQVFTETPEPYQRFQALFAWSNDSSSNTNSANMWFRIDKTYVYPTVNLYVPETIEGVAAKARLFVIGYR